MNAITPIFLMLAALAGDGPFTGLESPDPARRRTAADRIAEHPDAEVLGELVRAVRRERDAGARRAMIVALGRIGDRRAVGDLARLLDAGSAEAVRAIRAILSGGDPGPEPAADAAISSERFRGWWKDLDSIGRKPYQAHSLLFPKPEDVPGLLADLRAPDERLALRAAERLPSDHLTMEELRIQARLLARHPHSWALQALDRPLGTVDLPVLWRHLVRSDVTVADAGGRTHWSLIPEHLPILVSLLPAANREWFDEFTGLIAWQARDTDRFRDDVARGSMFALARIDAERKGEPVPALSEFDAALAGDGLPVAFTRLVENRVRMKGRPPRPRDDAAAWIPSLPWLRRWAADLTPTAKDLPFLERIARGAESDHDRAWAVRALGRLDDPAVPGVLLSLASETGRAGSFAAAELARDGRPEPLLRRLRDPGVDEVVGMLLFDVLPAFARRRWSAQVAAPPDPDAFGREFLDPGPESSAERKAAWGVGFRETDRAALATAFPVDRVDFATLVWFLTDVSAAPLSGPARAKVLARLRAWEYTDDSTIDPDGLVPLLARIEVRDRKALLALLHHWVEHRRGELREKALVLLQALGDTHFVPAILGDWSGDPYLGAERLGRVRDPRVESFLRREVREGEGESRGAAMSALAVFYGLPDRAARAFTGAYSIEERPEESLAAAREMLLARDPVGAALLLGSDAPLVESDATRDARAIAHLKKHRAKRTHRWEAVAGLGLAGDADASREIEGLVRDGRIWIWYPIQDGRVLSMNGDPAWIGYWIDHTDATCCIGFSALETLGELFPLLCVREVGNRVEIRDLIRAWWRRNRDHLAWSRLVDGWVSTRE